MAERTMITQLMQVAVETTEGTAVAASKLLPSLQLALNAKTGIDSYRPNGNKLPTIHAQGKEWSEGSISGQPTYDELAYLIACGVAYSAPVQQSSTTAYKMTSAISSTSEDTVKTLSAEYGSSIRAHKAAGLRVISLGMKGDRNKVEVTGALRGKAITDGITLTASPTSIAQIPILPKEFDVYMDTSAAGLGGTQLTRCFSWEWMIGERYGAVWPVNSSLSSFAVQVEKEISAQVKLKVEADSAGMAYLSNMRAGTTSFARIAATGGQNAGTAIPYSLKCDFALQVAGEPSEIQDVDGGVAGLEWTFDVVHDATWGKGLSMELINKTSAL